jgi:DNA repair exonuclease SbcCD ATPase subunit
MVPSLPKLKLPRLETVALKSFSLFTANADAEFECGDGVTCLVGANGIGKSTLLAAINYCLTGIVADPDRAYVSMEEYYTYTKSYAESFFKGRIDPEDEEESEICVTFQVGEYKYEVRRGIFETDELRSLVITDSQNQDLVPVDLSSSERHDFYIDALPKHIGLSAFDEFVFLQHFLFTFDEQRKTLFWNQRIMERVLYRAFGLEPDMALRADRLSRDWEGADSRVRNYKWEATKMRKRINEIRAQSEGIPNAERVFDNLTEQYQKLTLDFEQNSKALRSAEDSLRDTTLKLADQAVRETELQVEYAKYFDRRFGQRPPLNKHPLMLKSLADHACGFCGKSGEQATKTIAKKAKGDNCPLCESVLREPAFNEEDARRLKSIDQDLAKIKKSKAAILETIDRLREAEKVARDLWEESKEELDDFDKANKATLESLRRQLSGKSDQTSLTDYREHLAEIEKKRKAAYEEREGYTQKLNKLQRKLESQYSQVENNFVPRFAKLAESFLGMPLTVQLDARGARDVKLVVGVRGSMRRHEQQLSESQRFFLDIALRMALIQHMSDPDSRGGLLLDTPEGSLDIAYEKRAGELLATFAKENHQVIMTANLNSSQLLLALARECKTQKMKLCRMTDWAELSEVQQEEEGLFDKAYKVIESEMKSRNASRS